MSVAPVTMKTRVAELSEIIDWSNFNEPLCRDTVVALAVSVILKTRERNPASSAERRLRLIAPLAIREDRAPLVERFPLVHPEPSRNTGPALEGPGETLTEQHLRGHSRAWFAYSAG